MQIEIQWKPEQREKNERMKCYEHRTAAVVRLMLFQTIDQIYGCRVCWTQRILQYAFEKD